MRAVRLRAALLACLAVLLLSPTLAAWAGVGAAVQINEILFNPTGIDGPNEYIELRGAPNASLSGLYLVGIEGDTAFNQGDVQDIFDLNGRVLGTNGYVVFRQKGSQYVAAAGAQVYTNSGTGNGWGSGASSDIGHSADADVTDIENASVTFFLIQAATAPTLTDDIDSDNNGTPDGSVYAGWTILDSVSVLDNDGAGDYAYGDIVFRQNAAAGALPQATVVSTPTFTAGYVGRSGDTTGFAAADWAASDSLVGTAPNWSLGVTTTVPVTLAGRALNHIGSTNFPTSPNSSPQVNALPSGASAVIGDPTQPSFSGAAFGFNFSVVDTETIADALTVNVSNSNPAVLSSAAVVDTGSGTWRLDLGAPTGTVGRSTVIVSVSDGVNTTEATFHYGASASDPARPNARWFTGTADGSTMQPLFASFFAMASDTDQFIRLYNGAASGAPLESAGLLTTISGPPLNLDGSGEPVDIEATTGIFSPTSVRMIAIGSHSNSSAGALAPNHNRLFAADVNMITFALSFVGYYEHLRTDLVSWDSSNVHGLGANYFGLAASAASGVLPEAANGFNIEGLAMAPGSATTAYVGFRAPLVPGPSASLPSRTHALIMPVTNVNTLVGGGQAAGSATFGTPIRLNLGGRGIRSIECRDGVGCIIIAGAPDNTSNFAIYTWSGNPADAPQLRAANLSGLNPEGFNGVPASLNATDTISVMSDNGSTIYYNDGVIATNLPAPGLKKFRVDTVQLGAVVPPPPVINEFSVSHTGTDSSEYIELFGAPSTSYSTYSVLQIDGDSGSTGVIDSVDVVGATDASGYWWTGFQTNRYENGSITLLLVENFTGAVTNDLDTNDDGTLDVTPWSSIVDAVAVNDGGSTDRTYGTPVLGVAYDTLAFAPGGASRIPNGTDTNAVSDWVRNDFDLAGIPGFTGTPIFLEALNTPNAVNQAVPQDAAPTVTGTTPPDNGTNVPANTDIVINFSEAVTVTGSWYTISCTTSTNVTAVQTGGPTSFTLNPDADFAPGETCTLTVVAAQVADQDGTPTNMAANYVFDFTIASGDVCAGAFTPIYTLQEGGANFGQAGPFTVEGIITGDFQLDTQLNGFFVQDATGDANNATSDGIFVFDPQPILLNVIPGQRVRVTGTVSELTRNGQSGGMTQITASAVNACGDTGTITPVTVTLPFANATFGERYEGMLTTFAGTLTVNETFSTGSFGEVVLASGGRLYQPTNVVAPGAAANALQAQNDLRRIVMDDGSNRSNPDPTPYLNGAEPTLRIGDSVTNLTGNFTFDFGVYRVHPTTAPTITRANPRPTSAPNVGGTVQVASFNVLNYFNGNGAGGGFPTPRGANTAAEFTRQRDKTIAAINAMNADVIGLMEMENEADGANSALQDLVNGLNAAAGAGTYAAINTGMIGTDAIKLAFIYRPSVVTPVGSPMIDNNAINSRPTLAQTFSHVSNGQVFSVVVNHFKSKGCDGATGLDLDQGDGQSCFNATRVQQATRLNTWINTTVIPTSGDPDVLIIGDLNAYMMENPITTLTSAGYVNLISDPNAYSYVFQGQSGSLDHALATASMAAQVSDAEKWHINADEPPILDYNVENKSPAQQALNVGTPYRSSDHDPVIIGLNLAATNLLGNGDFSAAIGTPSNNWFAYGQPTQAAISYRVEAGVMEFYRTNTGTQAVVYQNSNDPLPVSASVDVSFQLGNSSAVRQRVQVVVHDLDFTDLYACSFWLAPNQPLATYQMQLKTTEAWTNASVSFYAAAATNVGYIRLDNAVMAHNTGANYTGTFCIDPNTPAPGSGADTANLLTNADFAAATITPWFTWGQPTLSAVQSQLVGGVFQMYRNTGTTQALVAQNSGVSTGAPLPMEATFQLGNSSTQRKRVNVIVHDQDFSDLFNCSFWIEPNTPLQSYAMRGHSTEAWSGAMLSIYLMSADGQGWMLLDNASLRARPTLDVNGTECYAPGSVPVSVLPFEPGFRAGQPVETPVTPETPVTSGIEPTPFAPLPPITGVEEGQSGEGQLTEEGLGG
jgi:predicted extracellular nuclease